MTPTLSCSPAPTLSRVPVLYTYTHHPDPPTESRRPSRALAHSRMCVSSHAHTPWYYSQGHRVPPTVSGRYLLCGVHTSSEGAHRLRRNSRSGALTWLPWLWGWYMPGRGRGRHSQASGAPWSSVESPNCHIIQTKMVSPVYSS